MNDVTGTPGADHQIIQPERLESSDRTARHSIPNQIREIWRSLSKSNRLALMLYKSAHYQLDDLQLKYIANFQRGLNLPQIQKSMKFLHILTTNPRVRARLHSEEFSVPYFRERPFHLREKRRIGVGYRDKGSLPKNSKPSWDKENLRPVSVEPEYHSLPKEFYQNPMESIEGQGKTEPDKVISDEEETPQGRFHSLYLPLILSVKLETLSISEEISGFNGLIS